MNAHTDQANHRPSDGKCALLCPDLCGELFSWWTSQTDPHLYCHEAFLSESETNTHSFNTHVLFKLFQTWMSFFLLNKWRYFEESCETKSWSSLTSIALNKILSKSIGTRPVWLPTYLKITYFVLNRKKEKTHTGLEQLEGKCSDLPTAGNYSRRVYRSFHHLLDKQSLNIKNLIGDLHSSQHGLKTVSLSPKATPLPHHYLTKITDVAGTAQLIILLGLNNKCYTIYDTYKCINK